MNQGVRDNTVAGNYIGTDVSGTVALSNGTGVFIGYGANENVIGTNGDGQGDQIEGNLISGNSSVNIAILQSNDNVVAGNLIGTDASGMVALDNVGKPGGGFGISLNNVANVNVTTSGNRIGSDRNGTSDALEANVIAGAKLDGIIFTGGAEDNSCVGNFIGVADDGTTPIANARHGIVVLGANAHRIAENAISHNTQAGISVINCTEVTITENSISSNGGLGIVLTATSPVPNDDGDPDSGANNLQNYPLLTSVSGGPTTRIVGVLNSAPSEEFVLEFFASDQLDPSGHGEGERYLGFAMVTTDGANQAAFDVTIPAATAAGEWITATATDVNGNTSEFSSGLEIDNTDPIADAGPDQELECTSAQGAVATLDATGSSDPDGDTIEYEWSEPAGIVLDDPTSATPTGTFPIGSTMITLTVTDGKGGVDVDDVMITVIDTSPPEVECTTDVAALWPPNHQLEEVVISVLATDTCTAPEDLVLVSVSITSLEPDNATGDGNTDGDVNGQDGFTAAVDVTDAFAYDAATEGFAGTVELRAERAGSGNGRTYTITAYVIDSAGNLAETSCTVVVPHDRRGKKN